MGQKKKSLMFRFITCTWNPVTGCRHNCKYCWARKLAETKLKHLQRYQAGFIPLLHPYELLKKFKPRQFVFVCDMGDLFGAWVPTQWIAAVLFSISGSPDATFLLLTKNPERMVKYDFPSNVIVGATIETNRRIAPEISRAPPPSERFEALAKIQFSHKMLVVEPIMKFDLEPFVAQIVSIPDLKKVVIGYDNYWRQNRLPEPSLEKTKRLIAMLKMFGLEVETKTLREALHV